MLTNSLRVRAPFALAAGFGLLLAAGCTPMSPNLDSRFGESVRQARAVQTLNPDASAVNRDPVVGIDAQSAQTSVTVYRNTFREPPGTFNVLNIGGSSLGTSGN
jgi:hypothetical protein